jgi:hypothetical protein
VYKVKDLMLEGQSPSSDLVAVTFDAPDGATVSFRMEVPHEVVIQFLRLIRDGVTLGNLIQWMRSSVRLLHRLNMSASPEENLSFSLLTDLANSLEESLPEVAAT